MIKKLISFATFPGVIVHQFSHQLACLLFGVKVIKINYFDRDGDGYIMYENPDGFWSIFGISLAPLFINSFLTFILGGLSYLANSNEIFYIAILWLAVSIGFHAIPDTNEAANVLRASKIAIASNNFNPLHYIVYPFFWFLLLVNEFRFILIDLIWAVIWITVGVETFKSFLL